MQAGSVFEAIDVPDISLFFVSQLPCDFLCSLEPKNPRPRIVVARVLQDLWRTDGRPVMGGLKYHRYSYTRCIDRCGA